jgi:Ni/Co efflux regulator RcnB
MNRLLCAVAAIAFTVPVAALAQPNDQHDRRAQQHARAARADRSQAQADRAQARADWQRHRTGAAVTERRRARTEQVAANRQQQQARNQRYAGRQQRYAARSYYRIGHRPADFHRIRASAFRYPRGYSYRRWNVGTVLPRIFLSNYYYYNDWAALGLLPPPRNFVWVRYGPDLLLVNRWNGRIADVIYGAFY